MAGQGPERQARQEGAPAATIEIELPSALRELTALARIDYADAFRLETALANERTSEQWARAILEGAPLSTRELLRRGWLARGVRLEPMADERFVLGWELRTSTPDQALLAVSSDSTQAELLFRRERSALIVATFMQLENPRARAKWVQVAPHHRKLLRQLIDDAGQRATDELL